MAASPRILYWDLETSLQLAAIFSLKYNDYIDPSSLVSERYIISASWNWEGSDKIHSVSVLDDPKLYQKDPYNDKHVVETLHKVLSEADVLIHHNGNIFDIKYAETRMLVHGLKPLPPIMQIDTLKVAKDRFLFNSNSLNYLGKLLKVGQKIDTEKGLWMKVLQGDKSAIKRMVTYNKQDIVLLKKVFNKLQPYIANHINRQLWGSAGCPRCGSQQVQSRGVHRSLTQVYQRYQCQTCSGWFRQRKADPKPTPHRVL